MRVVALIQARMGSTRLPGKVLCDLAGQPMLARVFNRASQARTLHLVAVATTDRSADDAIVNLCEQQGWCCFRGSEDDVLDRYYRAAEAFQADAVVRITSDCPLIDAEVIDGVVTSFASLHPSCDYVSNCLERTFPRGLDVEVLSLDALRKAWEEDRDPAWREHVTPYVWRNPGRFRLRNFFNSADYSDMRWTVDTVEDLAFVRKIYEHFRDEPFGWQDVIELLQAHPDWLEINRHVQQKASP